MITSVFFIDCLPESEETDESLCYFISHFTPQSPNLVGKDSDFLFCIVHSEAYPYRTAIGSVKRRVGERSAVITASDAYPDAVKRRADIIRRNTVKIEQHICPIYLRRIHRDTRNRE